LRASQQLGRTLPGCFAADPPSCANGRTAVANPEAARWLEHLDAPWPRRQRDIFALEEAHDRSGSEGH
jgi:hypothetical protein